LLFGLKIYQLGLWVYVNTFILITSRVISLVPTMSYLLTRLAFYVCHVLCLISSIPIINGSMKMNFCGLTRYMIMQNGILCRKSRLTSFRLIFYRTLTHVNTGYYCWWIGHKIVATFSVPLSKTIPTFSFKQNNVARNSYRLKGKKAAGIVSIIGSQNNE
jgi:hypothetical protein